MLICVALYHEKLKASEFALHCRPAYMYGVILFGVSPCWLWNGWTFLGNYWF